MSNAISVRHGSFGRACLYQLDRPMVTHAHREAHLTFYVRGSTRGVLTVNGEPCLLDPLNGVAISPWEPHSFLPEVNQSGLYLVLYIRPCWLGAIEGGANRNAGRFGRHRLTLTPAAAHWVQRLSDLLAAKDTSAEIDECIYETLSRCYHISWGGKQPASGALVAQDRRISHAVGLMNERYSTDVDMDWLARESALSRPHFFKLFKREVGVTPSIYINTLRSESAIDELLTTSKAMTEIGFDLGFSSQASFTRFFRSNVGIAPSDYRRVATRF